MPCRMLIRLRGYGTVQADARISPILRTRFWVKSPTISPHVVRKTQVSLSGNPRVGAQSLNCELLNS